MQIGTGSARAKELVVSQTRRFVKSENRGRMKVKKAVILAAGMGTRMLPSSKVIPKEILPVVDTPAIQVVVEEAVSSGIEEIVFVVSPGKTTVVEDFNSNVEIEMHLQERGKNE